jgi:hypothetical protein
VCGCAWACIHTRIGPHDTPVVDGVRAPQDGGGR